MLHNGYDPARALEALHTLDPGQPRAEWVRVGMAAKAAGISLEDWTAWSSNAPNFESERDCADAWRSFRDGAIKAGTLYAMANSAGWQDPARKHQKARSAPQPPRPAPTHVRPEKTQQRPAIDPVALWERCTPADALHEYIMRKRGTPEGLRVVPADGPTIAGHATAGWLAVPAWSPSGPLRTLQLIPPDGKKLNLPGASFGDGRFIVGNLHDSAAVYIVEGIGQAWACWQATGYAAVVCFGAGRMRAVAQSLRAEIPQARIVIVPDKGKERDAETIAREVRGEWVSMPEDSPPNYDANDYAAEHDAEALGDFLARTNTPGPDGMEPEKSAGPPLRIVALSDLATAKPKAPEFWIHGILPARAVTLLGAHGGTGKSTLAAAIGAHLAVGKRWYGLATKPARVGFVSLEDDAELVRYRLRLTCEAYGLDMDAVGERMFILDGTDFGALVEEFNNGGVRSLVGTAAMKQIEDMDADGFPDVWIVDNASDAFDANENERRLVRAFIRRLAALARRNGGAVLLLAHIGKDSAKAGGSRESYSGSTAWHNSARSRLALIPDEKLVKLEHQKSNFGRCIDPLYFQWTETGALVPASAPEKTDKAQDHAEAIIRLDGAILAAIEKAATDGVPVPTATVGARAAGSVLHEILAANAKGATGKKAVTRSAINAALIRLEQSGAIQRTEFRTKERKVREVWGIAPEGESGAETAPNAPNAPNDEFGAISAIGAEAAPNAPN